jgi:Tfp pilus assembly protein PilF
VPTLAGTGRPLIFVRTFDMIGRPPDGSPISARALQVRVRDGLAHFDDIRVLSGLLPPLHPGDVSGGSPDDMLTRSDYALGASVDVTQAGLVTLSFRLADIADGTVIWTKQFSALPAATFGADDVDAIVRNVTTILAQPYGVIQSHHRSRVILSDLRFACLATAFDYWRSFEPRAYEAARVCLEQVIDRDPTFALGYASLAQLYLEEFRTGLGALPGATPPLDRGLEAARRAVELRPESARGHQALLDVLFHRGDIGGALAAGEKAVQLNPFDTDILADYGARLIAAGRYTDGLLALERAAQYQTTLPPWYRAFLFLGNYMLDRPAAAQVHARDITTDTYTLGWVIRAVAAQARRDTAAAKAAIARLVTLQPRWAASPRRELGLYFPPGPLFDRLLTDLTQAGLGTPM